MTDKTITDNRKAGSTRSSVIGHRRIGIDLDNTIIFYDDAFVAAASERGLIPNNFTGTKQQVRDHIRTLADGETQWQGLQGYVYGQGLEKASLFPGVKDFINAAAGHELFIVSHKTQYGHFDESKTDLRKAALSFLEQQGIVSAIPRANISFHDTRADKVNHIASLALRWFIDDLVEVYEEPNFPHATNRILFHPTPTPPPKGDWQICTDWKEIKNAVLS